MKHSVQELNDIAKEARRVTMKCIASLGKGHVGGALDIVDALTVLYYEEMNIDPANPKMAGRDRLVLSKGHGGPGLYAILALKGFFDMKEIYTLNKPGTMLPSHCDRLLTPGIDMTTGSLGQGLSAAVGMALADRIDGNGARVYCIIGDGESQEGQIWEAGMYAAQMKLGSLTCFLDLNGQQIDASVDEVNSLLDAGEKWRAFGWNVQEVNGHDVQAIYDAVEAAKTCTDKPNMIVMHTVKGKGWKRIEGTTMSHSLSVSADDIRHRGGCLHINCCPIHLPFHVPQGPSGTVCGQRHQRFQRHVHHWHLQPVRLDHAEQQLPGRHHFPFRQLRPQPALGHVHRKPCIFHRRLLP